MSFFNSEIVREEVRKLSELQQKIYSDMFRFPIMDREDKLKHLETLEELIDTQKILYARLSLSDDPEAKEMKKRILNNAVQMGMSPNANLNTLLDNMKTLLENTKKQVDKS
jgi:hypothetical protein